MHHTADDEALMRRAIALSQEAISNASGPPFGAVIASNGKVIAEGFNCVHADNDPTAHAEIVAIRNACAAMSSPFLDGCAIYSSSEPCPMCMSAIYWSRISRVYFSTDREAAADAGFDDRLLYAELQKPILMRQVRMLRIIPHEGQRTFDIWRKNALIAVQTKLSDEALPIED
ncbi:nucleoside deaminase [Methylocapsa palsarum]|uniref:tRNA(Arg) A34 adenosine deaminase TadA n=1 Tax=Methylocapsa palsarum TaxID=1612308 RepID=A0A1I4A674_9HYPH|nr:nucleoside deaminase [Methylocapsa palsarum]SFK51289.1 tRNA(Arg) A34 adenosine deaminase TadA [Methylocapsa palsarum]